MFNNFISDLVFHWGRSISWESAEKFTLVKMSGEFSLLRISGEIYISKNQWRTFHCWESAETCTLVKISGECSVLKISSKICIGKSVLISHCWEAPMNWSLMTSIIRFDLNQIEPNGIVPIHELVFHWLESALNFSPVYISAAFSDRDIVIGQNQHWIFHR